jgi:hypothetical protein
VYGDRVDHCAGFAFGLLVGDAEGAVADAKEFAVAPAIALEGEVGSVEVAAVGLDDESVFGPEEVDLEAPFGIATGALSSGVGRPRRRTSGRTLASSGLFSLPFLATGAALRHSSIRPRKEGLPRRPGSIDASIAGMSSTRFCAVRSKQLRSVQSPTVPARSTSVRAGLVQGIPSAVPASFRRGARTR